MTPPFATVTCCALVRYGRTTLIPPSVASRHGITPATFSRTCRKRHSGDARPSDRALVWEAPYGTYSSVSDYRVVLPGHRQVRRLGTAGVPHGRGTLGLFREQFFRAGHAHAGVLLVLSLVYFVYLGRAGYSARVQWLAGSLLLGGVLAQPGGFFVHMGFGQQGRSSARTVLTRAGALLIAAPLIILAVGLITTG